MVAIVRDACLVTSAILKAVQLRHVREEPSMTGPLQNVGPALSDRTKMSKEAVTASPVLPDQPLQLKEL